MRVLQSFTQERLDDLAGAVRDGCLRSVLQLQLLQQLHHLMLLGRIPTSVDEQIEIR
jgi:hypothetical protein